MRHLAARFFRALSPAGPPHREDAWARGWLLPGELQLWAKMSGPDRRHAVGVARDTIRLLGGDVGRPPDRAVVAAALLHDVGKVESELGTLARAATTAAAMVAGRSRLATQPAGTRERQWRRRVRLYLVHDEVGAKLLERAGSADQTVAWARQHHLGPERWTVDRRTGDALKAADGD